MARPRKNTPKPNTQELSLVPVEEQPYPLPEGWKWVRLLSAFTNHTDSKKKLQQKEYLPSGSFAVVDQGKELVGGYTERRELLYSGPLPAIIFGDHTRCVKFIDFPFVQGADGVKVLHAKDTITHKFFYYALINVDIPHLGYRRHFPLFDQFILPLPPLDEQERIVTRIESLFAKLDEAKEKAEAVLDSYETRKAAILHKAFTGELTAKWREERGIEKESWKSCILLSVLKEKPRNGYSPKPVEYETNVKSMTLSATTSGFFRPEFFKYIDEEIPEDSHLWLKYGDILIQRANSLEKVGTSAIYTGGNHEFIYPDLIMKLQVKEGYDTSFIANLLKTQEVLSYFRANATGTAGNMPKINQQTVSNTPITVPTLPEQQEITRILDSLLEKEQQSKEAAEAVLEQIDLMKKAILAKAFRGELG